MEKENTELLKRVEELEKKMTEKDETIKSQEKTISDLSGKLAGIKVDSLVRKVEETQPTQPIENEEITFDFDM